MYDYTIIGGGISGLYMSTLLKEKYPNKKILLLEKTKRLGGLIDTKHFKVGDKKIKYESGGAVLYSYQKTMLKLVKKYNIETMKIDFDKDNIHKSRFYDCTKRKTPLGKGTAIKFRDMIGKLIKQLKTKPKTYFLERTLEQVCLENYSFADTRQLEFLYGYSAEFRESNSYTSLLALKHELFDSDSMYIFKKGYEEIIKKMEQELKDEIEIRYESEVKGLKNVDKSIELNVNDKKIKSNKVIFTIPQQAILKLKYGFNEKELSVLENSVEPISLCRIFAKYDVLKNPWIKKLKYSSVNNPLKQIIPLRSEEGLVQISYSDWIHADYWGNLPNNSKKGIITKLVKEAMPWEKNITEPSMIKTTYWPGAIHFWKQGIDGNKHIDMISNIKPNIYICGESFSDNQGWCEGSVKSTLNLFNKYFK